MAFTWERISGVTPSGGTPNTLEPTNRCRSSPSLNAALIAAFKDGEDLHRFVGSRGFGVPPEGVTPEMRSHVKAMSYGLAYGLSSFGLARQLSVSVGEAQALMDDYFARFGAVRTYLSG